MAFHVLQAYATTLFLVVYFALSFRAHPLKKCNESLTIWENCSGEFTITFTDSPNDCGEETYDDCRLDIQNASSTDSPKSDEQNDKQNKYNGYSSGVQNVLNELSSVDYSFVKDKQILEDLKRKADEEVEKIIDSELVTGIQQLASELEAEGTQRGRHVRFVNLQYALPRREHF